MGRISIVECTVENLRNYSNASCAFGDFTVLVGENNEGKSSIVKMLDFLINKAAKELLSGNRPMSYEEEAFLMPANDTRHKARRFSVTLKFSDKREARPYQPSDGLVTLRMSISSHTIRLNLGRPRRSEKYDEKAMDLWEKLHNELKVVLIQAVRDASSSRFAEKIAQQVVTTISNKMTFEGRGGAPKEYREAISAIRSLNRIVSLNKKAFEKASDIPLLGRMIKDTAIKFDGDTDDVLDWIKKGLHLAISTGDHDERMVRATEVGNGLQSIIDIALTLSDIDEDSKKDLFLIVEEPEVCLHPSAQRELIIALQETAKRKDRQIVVTTHSPTILDEIYFGDIVLVRNQRFFQYKSDSIRRDAINTYLINPTSAESLFAKVVLLVEGPGDKVFFETIIKRLRRLNEARDLTKLTVQDVGSKERFAPWVKMFDSFKIGSHKPIKWLCVTDADAAKKDSSRTILITFKELGIKLRQEESDKIISFGDMPLKNDNIEERKVAAEQLNSHLYGYGFKLFSADLEWAIVSQASESILENATKMMNTDHNLSKDKIAMARKLGSIVKGKASKDAIKYPWIRAEIAKVIKFSDIGSEIKDVVIHAVSLLYNEDRTSAEAVWQFAVEKNPTL